MSEHKFEIKWKKKFTDLQSFRAKHTTRWPDQNSKIDRERSLAYWLKDQKSYYQAGKLADKRVKMLQSILFPLDKPGKTVEWDEQFKLLESYYKKHKSFPGTGTALYDWISQQAKMYSSLWPYRKQKLDSLEFGKLARDHFANQKKWKEILHEVLKFQKQHNRIPKLKDSVQLYRWVAKQRLLLKEKKMLPENLLLLGSLEVDLMKDAWKKTPWNERFESLKIFIKKYKRWPSYYRTTSERTLYSWCVNQGNKWRSNKNSLTASQLKKLESINFIFETGRASKNKGRKRIPAGPAATINIQRQ